jgi:hypothetical protein
MASKGKLKGYALEQQKLKKQLGEVEYARRKAERRVMTDATKTIVDCVQAEREKLIHNTVKVMQCAMVISLDKQGLAKDTIKSTLADIDFQLHCVTDGLVQKEDLDTMAIDLGFVIC